jgi:hypothetical protein
VKQNNPTGRPRGRPPKQPGVDDTDKLELILYDLDASTPPPTRASAINRVLDRFHIPDRQREAVRWRLNNKLVKKTSADYLAAYARVKMGVGRTPSISRIIPAPSRVTLDRPALRACRHCGARHPLADNRFAKPPYICPICGTPHP